MRNYRALLPIIILFTLNGFSIDYPKMTSDQLATLQRLKREVSANLTGNILSFWSHNMVDNINGGFYGRADYSGKVYPDADKGGIMNARILWTYSSAYRITHSPVYLGLAKRAKDYILTHFIDNQFGGAYRSLTASGEPSDTRKQTYTQSFFIYGLAEYSRATGDRETLDRAFEIFNLFEKNALDRDANGYFEVFSRDWERLHDRLIGESSERDEKTMNTHLHIMEAYTNRFCWPG
jgi:mannobiose 2-epimerase